MVNIICAGEFDFPNSEDPTVSRLNINFYSVKDGPSYTLRKNLASGRFEAVDETRTVVRTWSSFATALSACKVKTETARGVTLSDTGCNHTTERKGYCPTWERAEYLRLNPPPEE